MLGASNHSKLKRVEHDFYATDPKTIDDLFKVEDFNKEILEPACGEGHLSKKIKSKGFNVTSSDLIGRGFGEVKDFFDYKKWHGDIITNPPYKHAEKFVKHSLNIVNDKAKVAMFLKITFLESQGRRGMFLKNPPKTIYVYSKRQKVARNGDPAAFKKSSAICYCWFVWEKGNKKDPVVKWI